MVVEVVLLFARASTGAMSFADRAMGLRKREEEWQKGKYAPEPDNRPAKLLPQDTGEERRRERGLS